jgi:hypothetical protein
MKKLLFLFATLLLWPSVANSQQLIYVDETTAGEMRIPFVLVDVTDGVTPETGITISGSECQISKNGGTQANCTGTVGEVGNGIYYYTFDATEIDTIGYVTVRILDTETRQFVGWVQITDTDPTAPDEYVFDQVACSETPESGTICERLRTLTEPRGTAQSVPSGTSIVLASTETFEDDTLNNNASIRLISGTTGAGQTRCILDYTASSKTAVVDAWLPTPTGTITYDIIWTPNCNPNVGWDIANSELSAVPGSTPTFRQMLQFVFQYAKNKLTTTSTATTLYKDNSSTTLGVQALSDNGTTFTRGKMQ